MRNILCRERFYLVIALARQGGVVMLLAAPAARGGAEGGVVRAAVRVGVAGCVALTWFRGVKRIYEKNCSLYNCLVLAYPRSGPGRTRAPRSRWPCWLAAAAAGRAPSSPHTVCSSSLSPTASPLIISCNKLEMSHVGMLDAASAMPKNRT